MLIVSEVTVKTHSQFVFNKTDADAMQRVTRCTQTSGDALPLDEKLGNFENREIDKRLQLEVRVARLEKQRS